MDTNETKITDESGAEETPLLEATQPTENESARMLKAQGCPCVDAGEIVADCPVHFTSGSKSQPPSEDGHAAKDATEFEKNLDRAYLGLPLVAKDESPDSKRPRLLGGGIIEIDGMKFPPEFFEDIKANRAGLWRFVNKGDKVCAEFIRDSEEAMDNFNNMVTLCAGMLSAAGGMIAIPDGFVLPSGGIQTARDEEAKTTVVTFAK